MLRAFLEAQVDLVNAATLLKLAGHAEADDFFVTGGRFIGLSKYHQFARLDAAALRAALAREGRLVAVAGLRTLAALADPAAADHLLQRALAEAMRGEARRNPLSLAVPLSFVLDRRAEVRRIRLVLRGAAFGLPADELVELVEA